MKDNPAPRRGMVLAAGKGTRLRPLTDTLPKPLATVGGRTLIDRVLDRLQEAGVETAVVNLHHLGAMIEEHLAARPAPGVVYSREDALLETGGGVAKALPLLGAGPFYVVNGDVMWLNGPRSALARMAATWDDGTMDALLLLHSTVEAYGYQGRGDFWADGTGVLARRPECEISPYVYTGVQLVHRRLFEGAPGGAFSFNVLYDKAIEAGRLHGMVHDGEWFHIGTAEGLAEADDYMQVRYPGDKKRR